MPFVFKLKKGADRLQHQGELVEDPVFEGEDDRTQQVFRCRLCGLQAADKSYCPECLADTMEPLSDPSG